MRAVRIHGMRGLCNRSAHRLTSGEKVFVIAGILSFSVTALIDPRNLLYPAETFPVFEVENHVHRPVKVVSHEGYLLVQRPEGVAYNPPSGCNSTSNACVHCGQTAGRLVRPLRLIRLYRSCK